MSWPPTPGELLPRATQVTGIREKLARYSLNPQHEDGASKARGFALMLGITLEDIDHLETQLRSGILKAPIRPVRDNTPYGVSCVVELLVRGAGDKHERVVNVRTVWELTDKDTPPRLVTAYPRP